MVSVDIAKFGYEMAVQAESMGVPQNGSMTENLPHDDKEYLVKLGERKM